VTPEFAERRTPYCPGCCEAPRYVFDEGHQAWCGTEDCEVVTWDMYMSLDELLAGFGDFTVDLGESPRPGPSV
jgi:hypothetical protein